MYNTNNSFSLETVHDRDIINANHLSLSIIICTKNRPTELAKCIQSIITQSRLPDEIIIIDDGILDIQILQTLDEHKIKYVYHKKDVPGLTMSRNLGVSLASGDIITFIDDDVILDKDYIASVMSTFEHDTSNQIAGITGTLITPEQGFERKLLRLFFLEGDKPGSILPSGIGVLVKSTNITKPMEVQWLSGSNMSYRKFIFSRFQFNELDYKDYAWGEDREFSFRIGKFYKLLALPEAKLIHTKSLENRVASRSFGVMETYNLYIFFRNYMPRTPKNITALLIALFGIILKNAVLCLKPSNFSKSIHQLAGNINGLYRIITQRSSGHS